MTVVSNPRSAHESALTPPAVGDWGSERAILSHVLDQHPRRLTLSELAREVGVPVDEAVVRRAVANLAAARFLLSEGDELVPAPAVVSFDRPETDPAWPATEF